jgi:hypothetical protein
MGASRMMIAGAAALAAGGALVVTPASARAGSAAEPTWTKQAPVAAPPARYGEAMAYDAATGTVVLFGGQSRTGRFGDTWTWDGTTWTQQHPAASPPALTEASMAYDAATGTVVLFGGYNGQRLGQTWTWDGTTWTQQHPAARPPARFLASMAYDDVTGTVVLFGGEGLHGTQDFALGDTWTWDGTTWTKRHPAASPSARGGASMAYDAATGTGVLFGGADARSIFRDTWTWG